MSKNETLAKIPRSDGGINAANMNGGPLSGMRNKVINGDFDHWQRAVSQTISGYGSADRWLSANVGSTKTASRQAFNLGQGVVPGEPSFFMRHVVASVAAAANLASLSQRIESVRTLAGKKATLTFWAKADAPKNIALEFFQSFGTGGAPSAAVQAIGSQLVALTAAWQKFSVVVDIPSIAGKTLGSNADDHLGVQFWFDAGANFAARAAGLGQQSGTFDIAHVSLVEGDARGEDDPFGARHPQQELTLCQRYYAASVIDLCWQGYVATNATCGYPLYFPVEMRSTPTLSVNDGTEVLFPNGSPSAQDLHRRGARITKTANGTGAGYFFFNYTADAEL